MSNTSTTTRVTTRDALGGVAKRNQPPELMHVPEWGVEVYVARITAGGVDRYYAALKDVAIDKRRGLILAHALVNADGQRLYDPTDATHLADLADFDAAGAERVIDRFLLANGVGRGN